MINDKVTCEIVSEIGIDCRMNESFMRIELGTANFNLTHGEAWELVEQISTDLSNGNQSAVVVIADVPLSYEDADCLREKIVESFLEYQQRRVKHKRVKPNWKEEGF